MEALYVVLGAILSVVGGIIGQRYTENREQLKQEQVVLLEANDALLSLNALLSSRPGINGDAQPWLGGKLDLIRVLDQLSRCSVQLRSPQNRSIAVRLTKLVLDSKHRTEPNIFAVTRQVQLALNARMIQQYEADHDQTTF